MKKINMISRIIMAVITFIIFIIMIINEDKSAIIIPVVFSLIVFGLSFPTTIIAEKIIKIGDKINNKLLKLAYYIVLPITLLAICLVAYMIIINIDTSTSNDFAEKLGNGLLLLLAAVVVAIAIILPYIQAIIINILKKIIK